MKYKEEKASLANAIVFLNKGEFKMARSQFQILEKTITDLDKIKVILGNIEEEELKDQVESEDWAQHGNL